MAKAFEKETKKLNGEKNGRTNGEKNGKDAEQMNSADTEGEKEMTKTAEAKTETRPVAQMDISKLKDMKMSELTKVAREMNINGLSGAKKQDLIFRILQGQAEKEGMMFGSGTLEILPEGFGFL